MRLSTSILSPVREIKYPGEPARYFTDGGAHSDPKLFPHQDGNVVLFDSQGQLDHVYNYENTLKNKNRPA